MRRYATLLGSPTLGLSCAGQPPLVPRCGCPASAAGRGSAGGILEVASGYPSPPHQPLGVLLGAHAPAPPPLPCTPLLDHLLGEDEQTRWHGEAERFGRLEVDEQLDFRGLLDRQVGRLLPLENPAGVDASQTVRVCQTAAVA